MDVVAILSIAVSIWTVDLPALELRALAGQVVLPAHATEEWDAIGTFILKSEKAADTTVKLYYFDTDSAAKKMERKGGMGFIYPNYLSIHAVYREGDGPWKYKELYGVFRVGFWKVAEVKPEAVTIQVRSKAIIFSNDSIRFTDEELKRIYEPVPMQLTLKDGVPSLK